MSMNFLIIYFNFQIPIFKWKSRDATSWVLSCGLWPLFLTPHSPVLPFTRVSFHFIFFQRWQIIQLVASLPQSHDSECEITSTADRVIQSAVSQLKMAAIDTTHKLWLNLPAVLACRGWCKPQEFFLMDRSFPKKFDYLLFFFGNLNFKSLKTQE